MTLPRFLTWLLLFLRLNAADDAQDDHPADAADPVADPDETETTLDDFLDDRERDLGGAPKKGDEDETPAEKRAREAQERADAAERRAADADRRAREAESRATTSQRDPEYDREEARLADAKAKGQDTTWLQWQVDMERRNRGVLLEVTRERSLAADERDRGQFERVEATHPKLYAKYKERVEQWRAETMKGGGQPAPRLAILDLLIGNDMRNGKLKVKTKRRTEEPVQTVRVDRGSSPGPRSDVDRKVRQTESQKRRERLRNLQI